MNSNMYNTNDTIICAVISGAILAVLSFLLIRKMVKTNGSSNFNSHRQSPRDLKYELLSKVQPKQRIKIHAVGYVWDATCLNNTPSERKMFIRKFSADYHSDTVESYDSEAFREFIALNCSNNEIIKPKSLINELQEKLDEAVKNEKYWDACALRDTIEKLKNKTQ